MGGYARFKTPARPHEYLNDRLCFQSIEEAFIVTRKKKRGRQRERERERERSIGIDSKRQMSFEESIPSRSTYLVGGTSEKTLLNESFRRIVAGEEILRESADGKPRGMNYVAKLAERGRNFLLNNALKPEGSIPEALRQFSTDGLGLEINVALVSSRVRQKRGNLSLSLYLPIYLSLHLSFYLSIYHYLWMAN